MGYQLGVLMDPIGSINYKKDSTIALLLAAQDRGMQLFYFEQADLALVNDRVWVHARPLQVFPDAQSWFELGDSEYRPLDDLNVVLMRKDPPFNMEYIYTTYLLETAQARGTLVVNDPVSLRAQNEKYMVSNFPQCIPPTMVTASPASLRSFIQEHQDVVLKPLDGMGGRSIFRLGSTDPNIKVVIEELTHNGRTPIMAQTFIPEIKQGDKRIILVDGEPVESVLARIPAADDFRGNLAAGATSEVRPLSERERWICQQIGPWLKAQGMIFVGIDVIGDYLTEINITSPTCIKEIEAATELRVADQVMAAIEKRLGA